MQPTTRVGVRVTFLRIDRRGAPPRPLPEGAGLVRLASCTVPFYRYLYATVGGAHLWWLRRSLTDETLGAILGNPGVTVDVLYCDGEPAGFFELDRSALPNVNISYFGLLPHAIGRNMGTAFLDAAVEAAWTAGARTITVNTCTADHPRALPNYLRAGFQVARAIDEVWEVPNRLGLSIPQHLRL